jgi:hypothetical protein
MSKKKKSNQKGQTINLGDAASPHIGSGDADEREKKYEQPLGVKLERCSKMKDERPKRKGAMYMVTVPTVSPLFELCRQRGFFFCIGLRFFFLPFPLLHTLTIIPYYCSVSLCFLYTINLALNLCWSNCEKKNI